MQQESHDDTGDFKVDMEQLGYKVALDNIRAHPWTGILDQYHLEAYRLYVIYGPMSWNSGNPGIPDLGSLSLEFGNLKLWFDHFEFYNLYMIVWISRPKDLKVDLYEYP
jgi:hypothetical protein